jgi:hypothetical protein
MSSLVTTSTLLKFITLLLADYDINSRTQTVFIY